MGRLAIQEVCVLIIFKSTLRVHNETMVNKLFSKQLTMFQYVHVVLMFFKSEPNIVAKM